MIIHPNKQSQTGAYVSNVLYITEKDIVEMVGMGMGLSDFALASVPYEKASAEQRGTTLRHAERIDPISALSRATS